MENTCPEAFKQFLELPHKLEFNSKTQMKKIHLFFSFITSLQSHCHRTRIQAGIERM